MGKRAHISIHGRLHFSVATSPDGAEAVMLSLKVAVRNTVSIYGPFHPMASETHEFPLS